MHEASFFREGVTAASAQGYPGRALLISDGYEAFAASDLDYWQPFPSISTMDKPPANADGTTDICFGPSSPEGSNWLRTVPDNDFYVILWLYGPIEPLFNHTQRCSDLDEIGRRQAGINVSNRAIRGFCRVPHDCNRRRSTVTGATTQHIGEDPPFPRRNSNLSRRVPADT
jgi:hypothetical protein